MVQTNLQLYKIVNNERNYKNVCYKISTKRCVKNIVKGELRSKLLFLEKCLGTFPFFSRNVFFKKKAIKMGVLDLLRIL